MRASFSSFSWSAPACIRVVLVPQFLSNISGYNADQSGGIMLLAGMPVSCDADPAAPAGGIEPRIMVIGLLCFAVSCMLDTR